ncbi:MAG: sensor histidine kinase [Chloroflexota bacterium]
MSEPDYNDFSQYLNFLEKKIESLQSELDAALSAAPQPAKALVVEDVFGPAETAANAVQILRSRCAREYGLIDNNLYIVRDQGKCEPAAPTEIAAGLEQIVNHIEEHGISDWAIQTETAKVIPDTISERPDRSLIIIPVKKSTLNGLFVALVNQSIEAFSDSYLQEISLLASAALNRVEFFILKEEKEKNSIKLGVYNRQMLDSLRKASIGEITLSIASELETPIKIIEANISLIENGLGDQSRRFEIIRENLKKIGEINKKLFEYSGAGADESLPAPVNICELISDVILLTESQLNREGIQIETEFEKPSFPVMGIKSQIEHAFMNLILFAQSCMNEGGMIHIGVYAKNHNKILVTFTDNGIGLDEDELESIFEPFGIAETRLPHRSFSLYLVKSIIAQHKGKISSYSEIGKGTTFKISLPLYEQN